LQKLVFKEKNREGIETENLNNRRMKKKGHGVQDGGGAKDFNQRAQRTPGAPTFERKKKHDRVGAERVVLGKRKSRLVRPGGGSRPCEKKKNQGGHG